jgi:hypothetical protein
MSTTGRNYLFNGVLGLQDSDIDDVIKFCEENDLWILIHTLDDGIGTLDEERKFLRVTRYVTFKNLAMSLEYFLKAFADRAVSKGRSDLAELQGKTLSPVVLKVMDNEKSWINILKRYISQGRTDAAHFAKNLNEIQKEPNDQARHFLIACLARNLTVHSYPTDDWFYGDLFGEMMDSILLSLFYTWHVAKREAWI